MICETKKQIIHEMTKAGIVCYKIMAMLNVKKWQVRDANKLHRAKFECKENRKFKVSKILSKPKKAMPYTELRVIIAPLYTPYGTALTIGDVCNYGN